MGARWKSAGLPQRAAAHGLLSGVSSCRRVLIYVFFVLKKKTTSVLVMSMGNQSLVPIQIKSITNRFLLFLSQISWYFLGIFWRYLQ